MMLCQIACSGETTERDFRNFAVIETGSAAQHSEACFSQWTDKLDDSCNWTDERSFIQEGIIIKQE